MAQFCVNYNPMKLINKTKPNKPLDRLLCLCKFSKLGWFTLRLIFLNRKCKHSIGGGDGQCRAGPDGSGGWGTR